MLTRASRTRDRLWIVNGTLDENSTTGMEKLAENGTRETKR